MAEHRAEVIEEVVPETKRDPVAVALLFAIFFVIVVALTGILYLLLNGSINAEAPRTAIEAQLSAVESAVAENPGSGKVWADYIAALSAAGQYGTAQEKVESARKVLKGEDLLLVNIEATDLLLSQKKYKEAFKLAEKNLKDEETERARVIKEKADEGIRVDPKMYGPEIAIKNRLAHARAAGALKKWDVVIKTLTVALEYDPMASDIYYLRGDAYMRSGDKTKAVADFQTCLKYDPEFEAASAALKKAGVQ